jgi:pimeloyl-ACP methyl ester carboxylesterase
MLPLRQQVGVGLGDRRGEGVGLDDPAVHGDIQVAAGRKAHRERADEGPHHGVLQRDEAGVGLARAFYGVPSVPEEDQIFWSEYQHGLVSRMSKAELQEMYRLGIDLMQSFRFAPEDLDSWPGRVLILEADEDPVTPEQRAELRQTYPQAQVHAFHGAGHAPWMSHREEYLSIIKEFLAGRDPEPFQADLEERDD